MFFKYFLEMAPWNEAAEFALRPRHVDERLPEMVFDEVIAAHW